MKHRKQSTLGKLRTIARKMARRNKFQTRTGSRVKVRGVRS